MAHPILVVEDDRKIARVMTVYLEEAGFRVLHAKNGREAVEFAAKESPKLVILDLRLPDISGEEVCQEMKEMRDVPIIIATAKSSEEERIAGFSLGADDYITKPFSPRELVCRVRAVLKRAQRKDLERTGPVNFNGGILIIDTDSFHVKKKGNTVNLTPTEFKVLSTLASSPDRVFRRDDLVEKALGYRFEGYERTIDAHIKNIRQKIEDDPKNPSFILTIYGVGYKFIGKADS
jgi:DNA-binding response OmpR family regulator